MSRKRSRSENWLEEDKILLRELIKERVSIIENKSTDTNTNSIKVAAWADLLNSFNCLCTGAQRTVTQLKTQWGHMKISAKKGKAQHRKVIVQTGGGSPLATQAVDSNNLSVGLPNNFTLDTNEFDSYLINKAVVAEPDEVDVLSQESVGPVVKSEKVLEPDEVEAPSESSVSMPVITGTKKHLNMRPAEKIAKIETECRIELHQARMKNEEAMYKLITLKLKYYERKMQQLYVDVDN